MPADLDRAEEVARKIRAARALGDGLTNDKHGHAVAAMSRHNRDVRHWRRCAVGAVVGIPVGVLLILLGVLAHGHGRTWPTYALAAGVAVFGLLALAQDFGVQSALTIAAGLHEAENETPHAP